MSENKLPEGFDDGTSSSKSEPKFENFKLEDDSVVEYRILPKMKSLLNRRDIADYWVTHFVTTISPFDGKTKSTPVLCIEEKSWDSSVNRFVIEKKCPLCEKWATFKNKEEAIRAAGKEKVKSREEIRSVLAKAGISQWMQANGRDGKYRVYAKNKQGKMGVLKLNMTCAKELRRLVDDLKVKGIAAMGRDGVWFKFTRVGNGFATPDKVEVSMTESPDGSLRRSTDTLTDDELDAMLHNLPDFENERNRIRKSDDVVQALAESDSAELNTQILQIKKKDNAPQKNEPADDNWASDSLQDMPAPKPQPKPQPKQEAKVPAPQPKQEAKSPPPEPASDDDVDSMFA